MSWILYSRRSIDNALNGVFEYSMEEKDKYSWFVELIYFIQNPVFFIMSIPCYVFRDVCEFVASNWRRGVIGFLFRGIYWKTELSKMGTDVFIDKGVSFSHPKNVEIGNNVHFDINVVVNSIGKLTIGNNVQIASGVFLNSNPFIILHDDITIGAHCVILGGGAIIWYNGKFRPPCSFSEGHVDILRGVRIKSYAALSPGAKVLPNVGHWKFPYQDISGEVTLGYACIIGANSFVKDSVGDFEIWAGSPAQKIFDWSAVRDELSKTNDDVMEYYD